MLRRRPFLPVALAALLTLGACDDDGGDGAGAATTDAEATTSTSAPATTTTSAPPVGDDDLLAFVDALAATFELPGLSEDTSRCLSAAVVGVVGVDLVDGDVSPEAFAQANTLLDVGIEVDPTSKAQLSAALAECDLGAFFASSLGAELPIDLLTSDAECIQDTVNSTSTIPAVLAASLAGDDGGREDLDAARIDAAVACEHVILDLVEVAFEDGGDTMNDELRACFVEEVEVLTGDELAQFVLADPSGETLAAELTDACAPFLGG